MCLSVCAVLICTQVSQDLAVKLKRARATLNQARVQHKQLQV